MKKIFYFIASAIVALGAVACQNDIEENINNNQQTEGLSINVTIAEQTRVELGALNEETKQRKLTFTEGDVLVARSGYQEGTNYYFKYTKAEGDVYTFTCEDEGVSSLVGTKPCFFYLGGLHEQADELILHGAICNTAAENISGIGLSSNEVAEDWTLGDAEYTVTLSANPILKFTANEPVTFSCDRSVFFVNGEATNEYTTETTTGEIIYLPILSSSGIKCTVTVTTESGFNKSFTKSLQTDTIYNLGNIEAPAKAYLVPNDNWKADGAWFAAYFFTKSASEQGAAPMLRAEAANAEKWVKMTDENNDGIFECIIPEGFTTANVIFCRMANTATEENFGTWQDVVWNQTADLTIDTTAEDFEENNHCYIYDWGYSEWSDETTDPFVSVAGDESAWSVAGVFNGWAEAANIMKTTDTYGLYVAKGIELTAGGEFKIKDKTTWDISYGRGIAHLNPNHYMNVVLGSQDNISVAAAGTYDIYFNFIHSLVYLVEANGDVTKAEWQGEDGSVVTGGGEESTPGEQSEWAIITGWNGATDWTDIHFVTTETTGIVVLENAELKAAKGFLIRKPATEWADKYGAATINYLQTNKFITTSKNGADLCVEADGTYDIYFDVNTKNIYIMADGVDYTTATEQTENGKEPENEDIEVVDGTTLYLVPNSNWLKDGARFAIYSWDGGEFWMDLTKESDGSYKVVLPKEHNGTKVSNIIFVRMNGATTANNWNNKWNQTDNLVIPTDGKNCYTVQDGTWDKGGGSWSTK